MLQRLNPTNPLRIAINGGTRVTTLSHHPARQHSQPRSTPTPTPQAFMVHFILWSTFIMSLSAGILLICFQKPATDGVGVCFIAFAVGNGYACWVSPRIGFCAKVFIKSMEPASKFPDLNQPLI
ncbi:hypothetical protein SLA2020_067060 [Shorea laevis]